MQDSIGATVEMELFVSLTLNLPPEAEAELESRANRARKSIEDFVLLMAGIESRSKEEELSPEDRAAAFKAWSESHRDPLPLSGYAVSRESMHESP